MVYAEFRHRTDYPPVSPLPFIPFSSSLSLSISSSFLFSEIYGAEPLVDGGTAVIPTQLFFFKYCTQFRALLRSLATNLWLFNFHFRQQFLLPPRQGTWQAALLLKTLLALVTVVRIFNVFVNVKYFTFFTKNYDASDHWPH